MSMLQPVHLDFWLMSSRWFGMTMYPGYADTTYYSPIHLDGFQLLDDDHFHLDFQNIGYAGGVQNFTVEFELIRGTTEYQLCFAKNHPDRTYVFVPLTRNWIESHTPYFAEQFQFDSEGVPVRLEARRQL